MSAVAHVHLGASPHVWPGWTTEDSLLEILPDLYRSYPPENDLEWGVADTGDDQSKHSWEMGHLREDTFRRLAEGGSATSGLTLDEFIRNAERDSGRARLLAWKDVWSKNHAEQMWRPLSPEHLREVLTKGAQPVRDPAELFALVCESLEEVRDKLKSGEIPLKELLWADNKKPRIERMAQIVLANELMNHSTIAQQRLVCGRELEAARNFPDIFVTCVLPNNERSKVYVEVKRQQHKELLSAPEEQLTRKYLQDPEARYGIYAVVWYGPDSFGAIKRKLRRRCGMVPNSPLQLQTCLQDICNELIALHPEVDGIRAMVIDASTKK